MAQDLKLQLINSSVPSQFLKRLTLRSSHQMLFNNYLEIQTILKNNRQAYKSLEIYDQTLGMNKPGKIFRVNDHINRIGHNPFIGNQSFFNIDFINVTKLYTQHPKGIITNSCGDTLSTKLPFPSSHLANIAIMGHIFKYKIYGYLIHA